MSFIATLASSGFKPIQDHRDKFTDAEHLSFRAVEFACRIKDRDDKARWIIDPETIGDILCATVIKPGKPAKGYASDNRSIAGWAYAWPMTVGAIDPTKAAKVVTSGGDSAPAQGPLGAVTPGARTPIDGGSTRPPVTVEVSPCGDINYKGDGRFAQTRIRMDGTFPDFHKGALGIVISSTEEARQTPLYFPTDPRLIAVNAAGNPASASLVCDLQADGSVDPTRTARLHSQFRVVKMPTGKLPFLNDNLLVQNYAPAGVDGIPGYGGVFDEADKSLSTVTKGAGPKDYAVNMQFNGKSAPAFATGLMSRAKASGPIDVGCDKGDQHEIGVDADGNRINSAHISTDAYFRRQGSNGTEFDGPLRFEPDYYSNPPALPYRSRVHRRWDPKLSHPFLGGKGIGQWREEAEYNFEKGGGKPTTPTVPPPPPTTPRDPTEPPQTPHDPPRGPGDTTPNDPAQPGNPNGPGKPPASSTGPQVGQLGPVLPPTTGGGYLPLFPLGGGLGGGGLIPAHDGQGSPANPYDRPQTPWVGGAFDPSAPPEAHGGGSSAPPAPGPVEPPKFPDPTPAGKYGPVGHPLRKKLPPKQEVNTAGVFVSPLGTANGAVTWPGKVDPSSPAVLGSVVGLAPPSNEQVRPWAPEDGHEVEIRTNLQTSFPSVLFKANSTNTAHANVKVANTLSPSAAKDWHTSAPITMRADAFAGQTPSGAFAYTQQPSKGRYDGGTANGGVLLTPPEMSLEDQANGFSRASLPTSTAYFAAVPGVYFAGGQPIASTGGIKTGYRWGVSVSGVLNFDRMSSSGVATSALRLAADGSATVGQITTGNLYPTGPNAAHGETLGVLSFEELVTIGTGATTSMVTAIPAGSFVLNVVCRVTVAIPTVTDWNLGDATVSDRYAKSQSPSANTTTTNGAGNAGAVAPAFYGAPTNLSFSHTGSDPVNTNGRVRVMVWYVLGTPPTS